jgi:hypothetical protein
MPIPVQDNQPTNPNPPTANPEVIKQPEGTTTSENTTPSAEDLITRASGIELDKSKSTGNANQTEGDILDSAGFDRNKWNDMLGKLPEEQRTQLESAYKSLQSGADKKFQKAAELAKQAQESSQQPWTLERINALTQDPNFVQAAEQYARANTQNQNPQGSGLSEDEWSNLSDTDKAKFSMLTKNQEQLQGQLNSILLSQQDEQLKTRYKNYDTESVNGLRQQLLNGQVQATNEHLWKVLDYEPAVERAYKLGLQDRQSELGVKQNASSVGEGGVNVTPQGEIPVKEKGENTTSFFRRIAERNKQRFADAQNNTNRS